MDEDEVYDIHDVGESTLSQEEAYAMWKAFVDKRKAESLGDGVGLQCAECDKEIAYSARHWSMADEDWYCIKCWGAR